MKNNCGKCGAIMPSHLEKCAFCESSKAGKAVKNLFGTLFQDARAFINKDNKVRIKEEEKK